MPATKTKPKSKKTKKAKLGGKAKTIHLAILLDESGSMSGNEKSVIDGTNEFVGDLAGEKNAEKARITVGAFDSNAPMVRYLATDVGLKEFKPLTAGDYHPRGLTPLYDSIAVTINRVEQAKGKKDKALVIIFTDGYENHSTEYDQAKIKALIEKKESEGFDFIYLGANVDAVDEGGMLSVKVGTTAGASLNFRATAKGTTSALRHSAGMAQSYLASEGDYGAMTMDSAAKVGDTIPEDGSTSAGSDPSVVTPSAPTKTGSKKVTRNSAKAKDALSD